MSTLYTLHTLMYNLYVAFTYACVHAAASVQFMLHACTCVHAVAAAVAAYVSLCSCLCACLFMRCMCACVHVACA